VRKATRLERKALRDEEEAQKQLAEEKKRLLLEKKMYVIRGLRKRLKVVDTVCAIFAMVGLILAFIENEDYYSDEGKTRNESSVAGSIMRGVVALLTIILLVLIVKRSYTSY
jgi:hypothetical protein